MGNSTANQQFGFEGLNGPWTLHTERREDTARSVVFLLFFLRKASLEKLELTIRSKSLACVPEKVPGNGWETGLQEDEKFSSISESEHAAGTTAA